MSESAIVTEAPVFELSVIATDVSFEIRVNDVPVLRMPVGRVQTVFDINPQIVDGDNALSLTVKPRTRGRDFSEHAACRVELRRRPHPDSETAEPIGALVFSGYGTGAVTGFAESASARGGGPVDVERFGARATLRFPVKSPFGEWEYTKCQKLAPTEDLRAELLAEMKRIHALLARRDGAALQALCELQAADYQRAYYLPSIQEARRFLGIDQLLADPGVEIEPFPDSILQVELLAGGRLVQLVDDDGKGCLRLRSTESPALSGRFTCILCKTARGYQIAR